MFDVVFRLETNNDGDVSAFVDTVDPRVALLAQQNATFAKHIDDGIELLVHYQEVLSAHQVSTIPSAAQMDSDGRLLRIHSSDTPYSPAMENAFITLWNSPDGEIDEDQAEQILCEALGVKALLSPPSPLPAGYALHFWYNLNKEDVRISSLDVALESLIALENIAINLPRFDDLCDSMEDAATYYNERFLQENVLDEFERAIIMTIHRAVHQHGVRAYRENLPHLTPLPVRERQAQIIVCSLIWSILTQPEYEGYNWESEINRYYDAHPDASQIVKNTYLAAKSGVDNRKLWEPYCGSYILRENNTGVA